MREHESDALLERTARARREAWARFGELDPDVLTHLINPAFMGGPAWPALRQAFQVVRRGAMTLLASDGLSDPFDDEQPPRDNGFGLELFALTEDPLEQVPGSWLWDVVWQMSQFAASHGGVARLLDEMGTLSTELYDVAIPDAYRATFVNEHERVGVLLAPAASPLPARIEGPLSPIRLVNVKLLTLAELELAVTRKDEGRAELTRRFERSGDAQASSLTGTSVV